jgi:hypothetical protein
MALKQNKNSLQSPDGSYYGCLTDGAGNLVVTTTAGGAGVKQAPQSLYAPDGSYYMTLTDGNGNLV